MPGALETIKEYLVSLGFSVDKGSYDQTNKAMDTLDKGLKDFASGAILNFGKAALAVTGFFVAANVGISKLLGGLGNQEIQMEMLSRQLWTTQQQAMAFNATLKSMGATLQELYLSPTLMSQYKQLHGVALQMQTPGDYNKQIQMIQDVSLQFKQMRLEAYYSLQWIGYYFIKYMSGPISKVHDVLQSINKVIVKNMPTWTKQVALVMASFVQAGQYIVQALGDVWKWLKNVADYIPTWAKVVAGALALLSVSNPFMLFAEGITGAILLIDDFETYLKDPSKSAFPKFWGWLVKINKQFKDMGLQKKVVNDLKTAIHNFDAAISNLSDGIKTLISGFNHLFGLFTGNKQSAMVNFFNLIWSMSMNIINAVTESIQALGDLGKIAGDLMQGKWGAAGKAAIDFMKAMSSGAMGLPNVSGMIPGANGGSQTSGSTPSGVPQSYPYMHQHTVNNNGNKTSNSSSKTMNVHAPVTQHIHGSTPQHAKQAWYSGFEQQGRMIIAAFREIW